MASSRRPGQAGEMGRLVPASASVDRDAFALECNSKQSRNSYYPNKERLTMSNLIVVGFKKDMYRASAVLNQLSDMNDDWDLDLRDAVAVYRDYKGKLRVDQSYQMTTGEGAAWGGLFGGLIGALIAAPFTAGASAAAVLAAGSLGGVALGATFGAI